MGPMSSKKLRSWSPRIRSGHTCRQRAPCSWSVPPQCAMYGQWTSRSVCPSPASCISAAICSFGMPCRRSQSRWTHMHKP
eukprot:148009-Prorocentrum_lima.AAC.1